MNNLSDSSQKPDILRNYDPKTPILKSPFYMSPKRKKEVKGLLQSYEATKRLASPQIQFRESYVGPDGKGTPFRPSLTASTNSRRFMSTASTKVSRNSENIMRLQKTGWSERIGLPISKYNETVFPRYKILFDHLWYPWQDFVALLCSKIATLFSKEFHP